MDSASSWVLGFCCMGFRGGVGVSRTVPAGCVEGVSDVDVSRRADVSRDTSDAGRGRLGGKAAYSPLRAAFSDVVGSENLLPGYRACGSLALLRRE